MDGSAFCNRCGAAQKGDDGGSDAAQREETLWSGRPSLRAELHWVVLSGVWIALVLGGALGFMPRRTSQVWAVAALLALLPPAWILGQALVRKLTLRYRLTSHRLFTERGLLSRQHDELELIRVDDVSVRQGLLQRWFGVGTVTVVSTDASNPRLAIEGIRDPLELKERIRTQVRVLRSRTTFLETL
jgi:uncharacterized membrane protein YdbT with pleckstrin-like domain